MTGTGLKKCSPTTRPALAFPSSLAAVAPWGMAAAAIFVMLIELVLVARMASGLSSAVSSAKIFSFNDRFSDTAYVTHQDLAEVQNRYVNTPR